MKYATYNEQLPSLAIGFESIIDKLENGGNRGATYPPYNLITVKDDDYLVQLAVAGFQDKEIEVIQEKDTLTISGERNKESSEVDYVYQGIASRKFVKRFTLGPHIEVGVVKLQLGILSVQLVRNIPENEKPKTFVVNGEKQLLQE